MRVTGASARSVLILFAAAAIASAAMISGIESNPLLTFGSPDSGAMSFQTGGGDIAGAGVFIESAGEAGSVRLTLSIAASPNGDGVLASKTQSFNLPAGSAGQFYDVTFDRPATVAPGRNLYLAYNAQFSENGWARVIAGNDNYSGGMLYAGNGANTQFDLAFRLLGDAVSAAPAPTVSASPVMAAALTGPGPAPEAIHMPEPSTLVLLGAGLAGVGLFRRR